MTLLKSIFGQDAEFRNENGRLTWAVAKRGEEVLWAAVPNPSQMFEGQLTFPHRLSELLEERDLVIEQLFDYDSTRNAASD